MKIGFIGLGKMGRPMAMNLLKAGHGLVVHNRSRAVVDELASMGAEAASSPAEVAAATVSIETTIGSGIYLFLRSVQLCPHEYVI